MGGGNWRFPLDVVKDRPASGRTAGSIKKRGSLQQLCHLTTRLVVIDVGVSDRVDGKGRGEPGDVHDQASRRFISETVDATLLPASVRINHYKPIERLHPVTCRCKTLRFETLALRFPPFSSSMTAKTVNAER